MFGLSVSIPSDLHHRVILFNCGSIINFNDELPFAFMVYSPFNNYSKGGLFTKIFKAPQNRMDIPDVVVICQYMMHLKWIVFMIYAA